MIVNKKNKTSSIWNWLNKKDNRYKMEDTGDIDTYMPNGMIVLFLWVFVKDSANGIH